MLSVGNVGKKSSLTSTLDSGVQLSLVLSAGAGDSSGKDLAALADELSQLSGVLIVDIIDLVSAEDTNLFSLAEIISARCACGILSIHYIIHSFLKFDRPPKGRSSVLISSNFGALAAGVEKDGVL